MTPFHYVSPELRVHFGPESLSGLARDLDRNGCKRAIVFCGSTLARTGLDTVRDAIGDRLVAVFDRVQGHSPLDVVEDGARQIASAGADAVIALGGGSAIVTARAGSILAAEQVPAQQLCTRLGDDGRLLSPRLNAPKLPQFVVPTTPTTAASKAGSAVLEPSTGRRLALFDPKTRARAIFIHPELARGAPADLVRSASLNALTMAVEGLESSTSDPLSDALLIQSVALISESFARPDSELQDPERARLIVAAILCGRGTDQAGGGIASVLGHAIGARFHVSNGLVNAVMLPHCMRFNAPATTQRTEEIVRALGRLPESDDVAKTSVEIVGSLLARMGAPQRLRELGVPRDSFQEIADAAMQDWFITRNPRHVDAPTMLVEVLDGAW
jgi:alcohol dehydrogenase class IV